MHSPGCVAQLVAVLIHAPKACQFNSQSGHISQWWVRSLVGACTRGNLSMFLSLSPPAFLKSVETYPRMRMKKKSLCIYRRHVLKIFFNAENSMIKKCDDGSFRQWEID